MVVLFCRKHHIILTLLFGSAAVLLTRPRTYIILKAMSSPEVDGSGRGGSGRSRSPSPVSNRDVVQFNEANGRDGFAMRPGVAHIDVFPSAPEQMSESSPFQFSTVVDYQWETQYTYGKLIATHTTSKFIAYVVKGKELTMLMDVFNALLKNELDCLTSMKDIPFYFS